MVFRKKNRKGNPQRRFNYDRKASDGRFLSSYDLYSLASARVYLEALNYIDTTDTRDRLVLDSEKGNGECLANKYVLMAVCEFSDEIKAKALEFLEVDRQAEADKLAAVAGDVLSDACMRKMSNNLGDEDDDDEDDDDDDYPF